MRVLSRVIMLLVVSVIMGSIVGQSIAQEAKEPIKCKCVKIERAIQIEERNLASIEKKIDFYTDQIAAITPNTKKEKKVLQSLINKRKHSLNLRRDIHKRINDLEKKLRDCIKDCPHHK